MTEVEWMTAIDPKPMLEFLRASNTASGRKLRLFACACVRRIWHLVVDARSRLAICAAEQFADGQVATDELVNIVHAARSIEEEPALNIHTSMAAEAAYTLGRANPSMACSAAADAIADNQVAWKMERAAQAALLRDIVANPFAPPRPIDSAVLRWNDGTVLRIATGIYEERAFERLPVLADALLDAGCDDEDLIAHCRSEGLHVRGCWAVDLILGKE